MEPESEAGDTPAKAARRRGEARARPRGAEAGPAEESIARIRQLVAAMRAEQDGSGPLAAGDPGERIKLVGWLRRFLDTRAQERQAWEEQVRALEARFAAAESAARAALDAAGQADTQHERLIADLKLMHEHQRSIWALERRRLEITIEGLQQERRNRLAARAARLARPAVAAGLLLVSLAALALAADSTSRASRTLLDRNEPGSALVMVLD